MDNLNKEQLDNYFTKAFSELSEYKNRFRSYPADDVEDAFQAAYYHIALNVDQIEVQGDVDDTIRKYFYQTMLNKLKGYSTLSTRYNNVEFVDEVPEQASGNYHILEPEQPTFDETELSTMIEAAKKCLTPSDYELVLEVYGHGRPIYAIASEMGTTKYLLNSRVMRIMDRLEKKLK